jgi:ABC-type Fe3+ transport system permease subunit
VIIKVLFAVLVLSAVCLIGVAIAVFVRVWWHLKSRRAMRRNSSTEVAQESGHEGLT